MGFHCLGQSPKQIVVEILHFGIKKSLFNSIQYKLDPTPEPSDEDIESSDEEEDGFGSKKKEEEDEDPAASNDDDEDDDDGLPSTFPPVIFPPGGNMTS